MSNKDFVKKVLPGLVTQVGNVDKVAKLPSSTLITAAAFPDDVLAITTEDWVIELADLDRVQGYEVYNNEYELLYNEASDLGLSRQAWGTTERDIYLVWVLGYGEYAYLAYRTAEGKDRVLLLVKF